MEVKLTAKDLMKSEDELAQEYEEQCVRNTKKLNLIDFLYELDITKQMKKKFIKYFYDNIEDMYPTEAYNNFKKL